MKKIIAALTLAASFPVMASGVYVGGQIGWSSFTADVQNTNEYTDNTFVGGGFLGYELDMNQYFVAIEGDITFGNAKANKNSVEYKRKNLYGISGLIGMPINSEFDIYGRVGWARAEFDMTGADKNSQNGYTLGLGTRYNLSQQMAVRLDYRYNKYSTFRFKGTTADNKNKEHLVTVGLQYMF